MSLLTACERGVPEGPFPSEVTGTEVHDATHHTVLPADDGKQVNLHHLIVAASGLAQAVAAGARNTTGLVVSQTHHRIHQIRNSPRGATTQLCHGRRWDAVRGIAS